LIQRDPPYPTPPWEAGILRAGRSLWGRGPPFHCYFPEGNPLKDPPYYLSPSTHSRSEKPVSLCEQAEGVARNRRDPPGGTLTDYEVFSTRAHEGVGMRKYLAGMILAAMEWVGERFLPYLLQGNAYACMDAPGVTVKGKTAGKAVTRNPGDEKTFEKKSD
jgi:hypothetical protein